VHPNIVQVLDVGEVGGALYLAMEYVRGRDLRELVKRLRAAGATMPLGEACYVVREVAQGLHHAYWSTDLAGKQLNVVHRDVSPHNIMLGYDGTVKLLDFGVAMSSVTEPTESNMIVGKWLYMSPEHTAKQQVDHRSDLFSLGVILYLMCSGTMPFSGTNPKDIVRKVRSGDYKPLEQAARGLPSELTTPRAAPPRAEPRRPPSNRPGSRSGARRDRARFGHRELDHSVGQLHGRDISREQRDAGGRREFARGSRPSGELDIYRSGSSSASPRISVTPTPVTDESISILPTKARSFAHTERRTSSLVWLTVFVLVLALAGAGAYYAVKIYMAR